MIFPFDKISKNDANKAGGKGASLGEMTQAGIAIPPGFVVLAETFEEFVDSNNLRAEIQTILGKLDHNNVGSIEHASEEIQELIRGGIISEKIQKEIQKYTKTIKTDFVAVRSSATAEDGAEHAWAGQLDTYLNVPKTDIITRIQSCWASLFTPRALFYRSEKGLGDLHISVAVVVQSMVDAESAGVAFSVHPVTENTDEIVIEGSWGLGEAVVSGEVTPDSFVISKSSGEIISEHIAEKKKGIFRNIHGENEWRDIENRVQEKPILTKKELSELSQLIIKIENHYGFPCDIEWAHAEGKIYILQARPITTLSSRKIKQRKRKWEKLVERESGFWKNALMITALDDTRQLLGIEIPSWLTTRRGLKFTHWIDPKAMTDAATQIERTLQKNTHFAKKVEEVFNKSRDTLILFNKHLSETNVGSISDTHLLILYKDFTFAYKSLYSAFHLALCVESLSKKEDKQIKKFIEFLAKIRLIARQEFENAHTASQSLFTEIGARNNLTADEVNWLSPEEIETLIRTKNTPAYAILEKRKFASVLFFNKRHYKILEGNEADEYIKQEVDESSSNSKTTKITGSVAYSGRVQGRVAIIIRPSDIVKMKKGDILITRMTTPNLLHTVQLAAAIVTDEGGITCHAAIISRELKIPCIIGTKNATKILKDGYLVEVDAENGVVNILDK